MFSGCQREARAFRLKMLFLRAAVPPLPPCLLLPPHKQPQPFETAPLRSRLSPWSESSEQTGRNGRDASVKQAELVFVAASACTYTSAPVRVTCVRRPGECRGALPKPFQPLAGGPSPRRWPEPGPC